MKYKILTILPVFLLTGCLAQSQVQYSYDVEKEDCQDIASERVNDMGITKGRVSALKAEFGECMRKQGWKLTTAKPPTAEPPIDAARKAGAINQAQPANPEPQAAVQRSTTEPQPQGNVQHTPASTVPAGASTYQPATGVEPVQGTAQPGRYFGPR